MKNGLKFLAAGVVIGAAAAAVIGYCKYRDSYELMDDELDVDAPEVEEEDDFEPVDEREDDFVIEVESVDE